MFLPSLTKDELIGHKLNYNYKCLFGKKLSLKDVYYNQLIVEIFTEFYKIDPTNTSEKIEYRLQERIRKNILEHLSFKEIGQGKGKSKLERKINLLKFNFASSYLEEALRILHKKIEEDTLED